MLYKKLRADVLPLTDKQKRREEMKTFSNFRFHMYTEMLFGKDTEKEVANMIKKHGGTKVMFVYGGGSIKRSGLYDRVVDSLKQGGIDFVELGGVKANPLRSLVETGLKKAQEEKVDFMLAVGGGSTIDTAKAIALGLANDGEYWQFYNGVMAEKIIPVGTIHTISAAGSETSGSSVIVDDIDTKKKYGFMNDVCRPVFAIMNPELTYTVSKYQTGSGTADIFAHTYMRYLTADASYLCDQYCAGTLKTVIKYGPIAVNDPTNYEARAELMLAGSFAHNDLTSIGRSGMPKGGEHGLEVQMSGMYDTPHGAGLAVVMPAMLMYILNHGTEEQAARVAQMAVDVFEVDADYADMRGVALEGIRRFKEWIRSIGMPLTIKELGIDPKEIPNIIDATLPGADDAVMGFVRMDRAAMKEILDSVAE